MTFIYKLEELGCKLIREGDDYDFLLLKKENKSKVIALLLLEKFVFFKEEKNRLNFKKFHNAKLIDIDIELDIDTQFLQTFFYDIETTQTLKESYFEDTKREQVCVNTLRYLLLLRGYESKYYNYFIEHKEEIVERKYCLEYLTKGAFRRDIRSFEDFLKVVSREPLSLFRYLKFNYLVRFYKLKVVRKRGKIVTFLGIDGSGKSTIIEILEKSFGYESYYLGDRSIRFSSLYKKSYLKPFSIFVQYFEKLFRVFSIYIKTLRGKNILTDRYYFQNTTEGFKGVLYNFLYNKMFLKPDMVIVLYDDAEIILQRKQEVSAQEIEKFNMEIASLPFTNIQSIRNRDIDDTLNKILELLK